MKVEFLNTAESEYVEAVAYYEAQQAGLGERFRLEIIRSVGRMAAHPAAYTALSERTRRCLVAKFPYGIIYRYTAETGQILIVSVAHLHRRPGHWRGRS